MNHLNMLESNAATSSLYAEIVVGRRTAENGTVEVRRRKDKAESVVPVAEALAAVAELVQDA